MSADFEKVLVKDPRLDVTDAIKYAVIKGGQNVTMVKYPAVAYSNSQLVWNVQVPSEQTIIDRRVLLNAQVDVTVTVNAAGGGDTGLQNGVICYGVNAALASFPIHQCMTTLSATINNNTVTCNIDDVLPAIIRLLDNDDLVYHNSYSPAFCDMVGHFYLETLANSYDYLSNSNTALWACTSRDDWHRGAFPLLSVNKSLASDSAIRLTYELTEPLLLSPFMFSKTKANNQGFYGIQNMNIVANLNNGARVFRGPTPGAASFTNISGTNNSGISAVTVDFSRVKPNLLMVFLTPHPSDLMPARNIVPYYELPRYINGGQPAIPKGTVTNGAFEYGASKKLTFNSIQLNQIPDKLIVFVRHTKSQANPWGVPDVALPINQISINFNNNSGILASAQNQQLWEMSKNNGANTNWAEWYGIAQSVNYRGNQDAGTLAPTVQPVALSGSYLVLEFGKDIQLTEDFYSCGSLGNFNLQMDVYAANNTTYDAAEGDVELVVITMNSGVFVCERGTSATYTGILTKQDVLECSAQEYYTHDDVKRLVGGGFWDSIKSGVSSLAKKGMEMGKAHLKKHGKAYMQQGLKMAANTGKKLLKKYTEPAEEEE